MDQSVCFIPYGENGFCWRALCGVNGKCLSVGGGLDVPGIHWEGHHGKMTWNHVAFLLFARVERRKTQSGGPSPVGQQCLTVLAPLSVAWVQQFVLLFSSGFLSLRRSPVN